MKCSIPENNQVFVKGEWKTEDPYYQAISALTERVKALEEAVPEEDERIERLAHLYDVGAVFISFENVNPSEMFGGTWEKIEDEFLLASSSSVAAGTLGGNNNKTITLSLGNMPRHSHHLNSTAAVFNDTHGNRPLSSGSGGIISVGGMDAGGYWSSNPPENNGQTYYIGGKLGESEDAGEVTPYPVEFDVIPNYIAVNVWRRIA